MYGCFQAQTILQDVITQTKCRTVLQTNCVNCAYARNDLITNERLVPDFITSVASCLSVEGDRSEDDVFADIVDEIIKYVTANSYVYTLQYMYVINWNNLGWR